MKYRYFALFLSLLMIQNQLLAQKTETKEYYGNVLNAGIGMTYYNYVGYPVQAVHLNYELQLDRNVTAAPFVMLYAYRGTYRWGDAYTVGRTYKYSEIVVPVGFKISYYLDELLKTGAKWDFYSSGALGFVYRKTTWEPSYKGKSQTDPGMGPLYVDVHIGTEYHIHKSVGLVLDISAGVSTLSLAFHLP